MNFSDMLVSFIHEGNPMFNAPCRSWLASEGDIPSNIDGD
jgi:hypothetical protein